MRLATFLTGAGDKAAECTIVSLGGSAGGLKANVERWANQIQLSFSSPAELEKFLSQQEQFKTHSGLPVAMVDFTTVPSSAAVSPSMIAAIITLEDKVVFIKMTGPRDTLIGNREQFRMLCQSLRPAA